MRRGKTGAPARLPFYRRPLTRRQMLVGLGTPFVTAVWGWHTARYPRVDHIEVRLPRLSAAASGLRIAALADTHVGRIQGRAFLEAAVAKTNAQKPDMVLLVGDYTYRIHQHGQAAFDDAILPLGDLTAPLGVYAVLGNHDYWDGIDEVLDAFSRTPVALLTNEHRVVDVAGGQLAIVGYSDQWEGPRPVDPAYEGLPAELPRITLAHNPDDCTDEGARDLGLMISGHTHGGQIAIPWWGPLHVPCRLPNRYCMGLSQQGANQLFVTRGVGSVLFRFRLFAPAEISLITLLSPDSESPGGTT